MPVSDEKVDELLTALAKTMAMVERCTAENSDLHREMVALLKENAVLKNVNNTSALDQSFKAINKSSIKRKPERPKFNAEIDDIAWIIFQDAWNWFKKISELKDESENCLELWESPIKQ